MMYSIWTKVLLATALTDVDEERSDVMEPIVTKISKIVIGFFCGEVSPTHGGAKGVTFCSFCPPPIC